MYVLGWFCYTYVACVAVAYNLYHCEAHQMPETMKQEVLQLEPLLVLSHMYSNKLDT